VLERFTDEARRVVVVAQEEARDLRADQIEPAHLLLALTTDPGRGGEVLRGAGADHPSVRSALARSGSALDADALAAVGIDLDRVRAAAEAAFGPGALERSGNERAGHIPFADGSKRVLEESLRHVLRQKGRRRERVIDSSAVLAGLLAVGDPLVERVLQQLGTDPGTLRERISGTDAA
jgi:ATP-dependent Clp protease ATP-binding subunit ClpA